jgi:dTDP-4-amino-4,6-dideoxygalactose transaminase
MAKSLRETVKNKIIARYKYANLINSISLQSSKKMPFICIVTPVFDPALDSLKKLIKDLQQQSFGSFIHILVSNGKSEEIENYIKKINKTDARFIYEQTSYIKTSSFSSILSNSGQRRDYVLKKYNASWFHFLDADVRVNDKSYFAKLFMAQRFYKTNILLVKTQYHGKVYPLDPINKEGHITISNYVFSNYIAKKYTYPKTYNDGDLPSDYRFWLKISKNQKVTFLNILSTSEGNDRSYHRMTDKKIESMLGKEMISVFGNNFSGDLGSRLDQLFESHIVGRGAQVTRFENEFKKKIGLKNAVATNSCTNAFWILLKSLNLNSSDEVIIAGVHFFGVMNVLKILNIKYKVADVDSDIPNGNISSIVSLINKNTRAIICLDYGGYPFDVNRLKRQSKKITSNKIVYILDAANSPFTMTNNKYTSVNYDYSVYSFDMNKVLVTGEGGMIMSNKSLSDQRAISYYGIKDGAATGFSKSKSSTKWWEIDETIPSLKLAMNNISAVIGLSQLENIQENLNARNLVLKMYKTKLKFLEKSGFLSYPKYSLAKNTSYLFWIRLENEKIRNELANYLLKKNIYTTVKYQPVANKKVVPVSWDFFETSLCLPINQNITEQLVDYIVSQILKFYYEEYN